MWEDMKWENTKREDTKREALKTLKREYLVDVFYPIPFLTIFH